MLLTVPTLGIAKQPQKSEPPDRVHRQVSAALQQVTKGRFSTFATVPSNVQAVESVMMFVHQVTPLVVLYGPSGWGKTHLLGAAAELLTRESGHRISVLDCAEWLQKSGRSESASPLILDQVQTCLNHPKKRQALRTLLDTRSRTQRPTLLAITTDKVKRAHRFAFTSRNWEWTELGRPARQERQAVIFQICMNHGLSISTRLCTFLAQKLVGNGSSLQGVIQRLGVLGSDWTTPESEFKALGWLEMHLSQRDAWDLRDFVHDTVAQSLEGLGLIPDEIRNWAIFSMLQLYGLPEERVANYYGLTTGATYRIRRLIQASGATRDQELKARCETALLRALG